MPQKIIDQPWMFLGLLAILVLLQLGAELRIRLDRKRKQRALNDQRQQPRAGPERRWQARPRQDQS